jgi:PAS domain S-box-containing protein
MTKKTIIAILIFPLFLFQFSCTESDSINKSEIEWLKKHPNLSIGISPNQPPYQFIDEKGEVSGMFIDFLTIIEERIGYKFKKTYQLDWLKLLSDTKEGNIDIILEIQETDERKEYLSFTPFLISHKHVIVVKNAQEGITSLSDLKDKKIAVVNSFAIHEYLSKNYPDYSIDSIFDNVSGLRAVSTGQVDAFITQQAVATYYIETEGISNLKIAGEIEYPNELAIASRKNLDTLNTILSKAVNSITKTEKQNVYNKWLYYEVKPFYQKAGFWLIIGVLFLFVILIIGLFNLFLRKRVKQKTSELVFANKDLNNLIIKGRQAEDEISKLNRVYAVLSNINQTIVHIHEKQTLFDEACRIAVDDGGFLMAWIGLVNTTTNKVDVVASHGKTGEYLKHINIDLNSRVQSSGPTGQAIKTGKAIFSNNIETDDKMIPWRENALKHGYRSSITLPVIISGKIIAAYTMYAGETNVFNEAEIKLLDEMASDISFALEFIDSEKLRKQGEAALRESEELFSSAFRSSPVGITITNQNTGKYIEVNKAWCSIFGYTAEEAIGHSSEELSVVDTETRKRIIDEIKTKGTLTNFELALKDKSGNYHTILFSSENIEIAGEPCVLSTGIDVTESKHAEMALKLT